MIRSEILGTKRCIVAAQPTLSGGGSGGGAVYDAVCLDVLLILLDIPVNLEIRDEDGLFYFKAGDADGLAEQMIEAVNLVIERLYQNQLVEKGEKRVQEFGYTLLRANNAVLEAQ